MDSHIHLITNHIIFRVFQGDFGGLDPPSPGVPSRLACELGGCPGAKSNQAPGLTIYFFSVLIMSITFIIYI